jgi:phosphate transport system protein
MVNDHISRTYDEELSNLQDLLTKMGNECFEMVEQAVASVIDNNKEIAQQVIKRDKMVNAINAEIAIQSQNIIALRSPMANDLRLILTTFQNSLNLERIGDLAKNIAKIVAKNDLNFDHEIGKILETISRAVLQNLSEVLAAFHELDIDKARQSYDADKFIDEHHDNFSATLMNNLKAEDSSVQTMTHLLFISRHLERVGDHAKNIAEATIYAATGKMNQFDEFDDQHFNVVSD